MDRDGFRTALMESDSTEEQVSDCLSAVNEFEAFLGQPGRPRTLAEATGEDIRAFAAELIAEHRNRRIAFLGLYRYAMHVGNHWMAVGAIELLGGYGMLGKLYERVASELGAAVRDRVFAGVELPALGTPPLEWVRTTAVVIPRLEAEVDPATVKHVLDDGIRSFREDAYTDFKRQLEESDSIDAFLESRRLRYLDMLKRHRDEGTLYYDQEVTDDLIDFVEQHREIGGGVRQGDTIIEIKIPHRGAQYLGTNDERMKRYHACHCPLAKESIPRDDLTIPPSICEICPSFNRKPWEVAYGRKLSSEILESALRGGRWCTFAIRLPASK